MLITINLSRRKESDADPKEIQKIEFVGQFKNKIMIAILQMQPMTNPCLF